MNNQSLTPGIIAKTKEQGGESLTLGLALESAFNAKNLAIKEKRFEDAARFREKEVELLERINKRMRV